MQLDLLPDFVVTAQRRRADIMHRPGAVEIRFSQELRVFHLQEQLLRLHGGVERNADMAFDHLGVDILRALLTSYRYPVIAVLYEIDVSHLIELHRWKPDIGEKGAIDILPASGGVRLPGEEGTVEIAEAIFAADDLLDRHRLNTAIRLPLRGHPLAHFMERDQIVRFPAEVRAQIIEEGAVPRALEIVDGLLIHARAPR